MAFGAKKIYPIDTRPGTGVGISIPFNAPGVFSLTYTTKEAIKNNLINFFLTNQTERYLNNGFGANLRQFLYEQINSKNLNFLKENVQNLLEKYFTNVKIINLEVNGSPDDNSINIVLYYSIINTGIVDQIEITFT